MSSKCLFSDKEGISSVAFYVKINEDFDYLDPENVGNGHKYTAKRQNGLWIVDNKTTKLKIGDVIYYWTQAVSDDDVQYSLDHQQYEVKGM